VLGDQTAVMSRRRVPTAVAASPYSEDRAPRLNAARPGVEQPKKFGNSANT
jgi:hypothetical protein